METDADISVKPQENLHSIFKTEMIKHNPQYNYKFLQYLLSYINIANVTNLVSQKTNSLHT